MDEENIPWNMRTWGSEMVLALEFFYEGEITAYQTADGENVYLAEVVEEECRKV